MKIGQKSFVVFVSKLVGSILGFVTTIYFARVLGATVLGYFAVTMALISWLKFGGNFGVSAAVTKRVSENKGEEWRAYATAGLAVVLATGLVLSAMALLLHGRVEQYVGAPVVGFVVGILLLRLVYNIVTSIINGHRQVHVTGLLSAIQIIFTSGVQALLVFAGLGLSGLLFGQWIGWLLVLLVGLYLANLKVVIPEYRHFRSLWQYARFSWLGALKNRSFNDVDILILGLFVPSSLVGVYSVAWTISKFLSTFDGAISQAVFPEISYSDANADPDFVAKLVTEAIRFAGLLLIPGLVGAHLLGDRLLRIYGPEFQQGTAVLGLLVLSNVLYGYQKQMLTGLNAIDRPDLAFRINVVFIGFNVVANLALIVTIGWVGAALATALSAVIGLSLSVFALRALIDFTIPYREVAEQIVAASVMGALVYGALWVEETYDIVNYNIVTVITIVAFGATVYLLMLWGISSRFRETVHRNMPFRLPVV